MRAFWKALRNRGRFESEMADELRFHLEARAADLEASGLPRAEAWRRARLELGSPEYYKEECRQARGLRWLDNLRGDLRYAWRGLLKNRGFAAVVLATLSIGTGVNTTIFALINSVMFKTLPVEKPEELQAVYWALPEGRPNYHRSSSGSWTREGALRIADMFSYPHFMRLRSELQPSADLFGHSETNRLSVRVGEGQASLVRGTGISWNYCRALGIVPFQGRTFLPEDEDVNALTPAVLLSYEYWSNALASDPAVIGRRLTIGSTQFVVVGILPPAFHGVSPGESVDLWLPLAVWNEVVPQRKLNDPRTWWVKMMARVHPGQSSNSLRVEIETRLAAMLKAEPISQPYDLPKIRLADGKRGLHWLRTEFESPLRLLMFVAVLILTMAVVNVAGLLLARAEARTSETGARLALGASRLRLVRQHLTESSLLACLGLAGGLLITWMVSGVLPALLSRGGETPVLDVRPDFRFAAVTILVSCMVALLFGLYPAWKSSRLELTAALKRSQSARSGRLPMGRILVGAQVGLSLILLVSAAMFLRTISNLRSLPLGFSPERLLVFKTDPSLAGYRDQQLLSFFEQALQKLSRTPGVQSVALSRHGLLQGGSSSSNWLYRDPEGQLQPLGSRSGISVHSVAPGYFQTLGIPLLAGRDIRDSDTSVSGHVVLVNRKLARVLRPDGGSPVGLPLFEGEKGEFPATIIGVVGDAKYSDLRAEPPLTAYAPFTQRSVRLGTFAIKTFSDPAAMAQVIRRTMAEVDPQVPIYDLRTQDEQISLAMERERILAVLLTGFGVLALILASVGIYGVLAYSVARRTSEIGIRLALGAPPATLRGMILLESLTPVAFGLLAGLTGAWFSARLLNSLVFGVKPLDGWSLASAVTVLSLGAALAAWTPAERATRISPITALRYE